MIAGDEHQVEVSRSGGTGGRTEQNRTEQRESRQQGLNEVTRYFKMRRLWVSVDRAEVNGSRKKTERGCDIICLHVNMKAENCL